MAQTSSVREGWPQHFPNDSTRHGVIRSLVPGELVPLLMADDVTTVAQLREIVRRFVDERDWQQFHSPKNLSMSLSIEAAELMEHFQWITPDESRSVGTDPARLEAVGDELADVLCYVLAIANELDIDLSDAMRAKMNKNKLKYPADEYRGRYGPEDDE